MQLLHFAFSILPFIHSMYLGHPWYDAQVWGNIFVVFIAGPVGWVLGKVWARSRYWPLKPLEKAVEALHVKHDAHAEHLNELHRKMDELHQKIDAVSGPTPPEGSGS